MRRLAILLALLALVATAAPAVANPVASPPTTPAQQLSWVLDASSRVPIAEAEQREHLSAELLSAIGGPEQFNAALSQLGTLTLNRVLAESPTRIDAVVGSQVGERLAILEVDGAGLIGRLSLQAYAPTPHSWSELDSRLNALAPQVSFAASVLDPRAGCRPVHEVAADTARPLGSAFKLYILGALGRAVAENRVSWDQQLAIREDWKSLPSGVLQDEPADTLLPLREYANLMISISDNTATDHLIHFLGRDSVHRQLTTFGNGSITANTPLLTTRELFTLKGFQYPTLADTYLSLPRHLRSTMLPALAAVPRTSITGWTEPRNIEEIEWFGSPNDMCRAYAGLWRQHEQPALTPVGDALSINDGGIGLDRAEFPTVWFKGGSEPGVVVLNHLAQAADGRVVVASLMLANPTEALDPASIPEAFALVRGGIELAE